MSASLKTIHADADRWRPSSLSVVVDAGAHQAPGEIGRQQQMINPQVFSACSHDRRNVWLRQHGLGPCSYRMHPTIFLVKATKKRPSSDPAESLNGTTGG